MDRLSPAARTVATAAAALSRPSAETLDAAFGLDLAVDAALLEAEEAGILTSDGGQLAFSHPLLAAALYGSLTGTRLRTLHRRLAAVAADPEERARHLARGVRTEDDEAAAAIEQAAALATRRGAPESAAELYEAAAQVDAGCEPGRCRAPAGRRRHGAERCRGPAWRAKRLRGMRWSARGRDRSERARSCCWAHWPRTPRRPRSGWTTRSARCVEAGDDAPLRIEILIALFEQIALDPRMAERRADEAIDLLRQGTDRSRLAQALIMKFIARAVSGQGADDGLLREGLALEAEGDGPASIYPLHWYHWVDDLEATRARYRVHDDQTARAGRCRQCGGAGRVPRDGGVPCGQLGPGRTGAR